MAELHPAPDQAHRSRQELDGSGRTELDGSTSLRRRPEERDGASTPSRLRPRLRDAQRDASRARVLDAARDLFLERGYEATTVRMIAERAQLSPAGLFTTFADKADILHHVRMAQNAELRRELERASTMLKGSASDRICELVRLTYEREWPHRPLVLAWLGASFSWSAQTEASMVAEHSGLFDGFRHILEDGVASGEFAPDSDLELALGMIWGVYTHSWRITLHEDASLEHTLDRVERKLRIIMAGLGAR